MSYKQLEEVINNPDVPLELIVEAGMSRLASWERPKLPLNVSNTRFAVDIMISCSIYPGSNSVLDSQSHSSMQETMRMEKAFYTGLARIVREKSGRIQVVSACNCPKSLAGIANAVKVTASSIEKGQPMDLVRWEMQKSMLTLPENWTRQNFGQRMYLLRGSASILGHRGLSSPLTTH